jgi:hypothetical protein
LRGPAARYDVARETCGAEAAREPWRRTGHGLDRLEALAGDAFRRTGSLRLAADAEERVEIRVEYEALREDVLATAPLTERLFDCPHYARQGFD